MKRLLIYILAGLSCISCLNLNSSDPYQKNLYELAVSLDFPEEDDGIEKAGIEILVEDINTGGKYLISSDEKGDANIRIPNGSFRINASFIEDGCIWQGMEDGIVLSAENKSITIRMTKSKLGDIIIKEIYCGGCTKNPVENSDFQSDKYIILHNNSNKTAYLDSLCLGTMSPYNSTSDNVWISKTEDGQTIYRDFIPLLQAVWKIGGDGTTYPLEPGQDAIIAVNGARNFAEIYPESVNLDRPDCFICYAPVEFPNTTYHPVPGNNTSPERIMDLIIKTSRGNAFAFSVTSPTVIIFKAEGLSIEEYVRQAENIIPIPGGSSEDKVTKIPPQWVLDGVEVFNGASSKNTKRLMPLIDAGAVSLSVRYKGKSLMRRKDEANSTKFGYEILIDTNNSTKDFYESEHASLWKEVKK